MTKSDLAQRQQDCAAQSGDKLHTDTANPLHTLDRGPPGYGDASESSNALAIVQIQAIPAVRTLMCATNPPGAVGAVFGISALAVLARVSTPGLDTAFAGKRRLARAGVRSDQLLCIFEWALSWIDAAAVEQQCRCFAFLTLPILILRGELPRPSPKRSLANNALRAQFLDPAWWSSWSVVDVIAVAILG